MEAVRPKHKSKSKKKSAKSTQEGKVSDRLKDEQHESEGACAYTTEIKQQNRIQNEPIPAETFIAEVPRPVDLIEEFRTQRDSLSDAACGDLIQLDDKQEDLLEIKSTLEQEKQVLKLEEHVSEQAKDLTKEVLPSVPVSKSGDESFSPTVAPVLNIAANDGAILNIDPQDGSEFVTGGQTQAVGMSVVEVKVHSADDQTQDVVEVKVHSADDQTQDVAEVKVHSADDQTQDVAEVKVHSADDQTQDVVEVEVHSADDQTQDVAEVKAHSIAVEVEVQDHDMSKLDAVEQDSPVVISAPDIASNQNTELKEATNQVTPSAPALLNLSEAAQMVSRERDMITVASAMGVPLYPTLEDIIADEELPEDLSPFSEEDLAMLYPNPQLDANPQFIDMFIQVSKQERHDLYDLLMMYFKTRQALTMSQAHAEALRNNYNTHKPLLWNIENRQITSGGRCRDGQKVSHSHSHKFAVFNPEAAIQVNTALKTLREVLLEELCMKSYSSQLARLHVEHYLFLLLQSIPELPQLNETALVTSWIPSVPPGNLDNHTAGLRDCISVLFMFERRPVRDKQFTEDCRKWLDLLLSALLRVATLSDHQFIFNHLLRCPPGVGKWAVKYLQVMSPLLTNELIQVQFQTTDPTAADSSCGHDWGIGMGLHRDWGGPLLDHSITMLATLLLPIKERLEFLALLEIPASERLMRESSQPWTIIEEDLEEGENEEQHLLLKECDFISFFDQFSFSDIFYHILQIPKEGELNVNQTSSHNMLRLIAFCTCFIRLLGAAFSTLRLARYKEFIKQVGRTIRQTVQYVADHWVTYKTHRQHTGDTLSTLPMDEGGGDPRYSLNRLQLEFDHFVLRATKWILTAHKLGAWQFLADMPYGSVSLSAVWKIFWTLYSNHMTLSLAGSDNHDNREAGKEVGRARERRGSPQTVDEITQAMKEDNCKAQFVDCLMKTYTSEAVFLLTTFVNMARSRPGDSEDERCFINTISVEIFECTQVTEFARDAYSRTGHTLLDSIAICHPFIISTLMGRVESAVENVGENCILLFKELPLHLWVPESHELRLVHHWLVLLPLSSHQNVLARVILSGLNWGTKSEDGSSELVLEWSLHRSVALTLVEAHSHHLPSQAGGKDYTPAPTGLSKYTSSFHRLVMSSEQTEFTSWAWEVLLMLKLHPSQILTNSMQTLNPTNMARDIPVQSGQSQTTPVAASMPNPSHGGLQNVPLGVDSSATEPLCQSGPSGLSGTRVPSAKDPSVYKRVEPEWTRLSPDSDSLVLPDLTSASERELAELRDAVKYEGKIAYYVALCLTSIGTDTDHIMANGVPMMTDLLDHGYYFPALRALANVTPRFFKHKKILLEESGFLHIVMAIANADSANISLKERITFSTPVPLVLRKLAALMQTQLQSACGPGGIGGDVVLKFWLEVLLAYPNWQRERSVLYLLDILAMAAFIEQSWQKTLQVTLLEAYRCLQPTQARRTNIITSLTSVIPLMGQYDGPPSLFGAIPSGECQWLAYNALCAEEMFEMDDGIWKGLLLQLKKDPKATIDSALKKALTDLKIPSGVFPPTHLCIYRWAEFCTAIDHTHPLCPLVWQRFFRLYLQRPQLESTMAERESFGLQFFSSSRGMSIRRRMKTALSTACKNLQSSIDDLGRGEHGDERAATLRVFLPKCLSFYQTLRLWLEEPRLHDASLYLPGLPPQYDPNRLATTFQPRKTPLWLEFVPVWEVKGHLNSLVGEWIQVAAYQKALPSKTQPHESSPDTAVTRTQKRLKKYVSPVSPPPYRHCKAPFSVLSEEILLSKEALQAVIMTDVQYIVDQARMFRLKNTSLAELDSEFMAAIPELYSNEPRQFHVRVPCHSRFNRSHQCQAPATIVFRFDEMSVHPKWEQRLKLNRAEYDELLTSLLAPISPDLCRAVIRIEHTVADLSKLSDMDQDDKNTALQCGISLFYGILNFIDLDTRQFPPSCQFLTSCIQILGQEFVQRDPSQAGKILELLLAQRARADLLAPLFQPNSCPDEFLQMYGATAEVAVKEGPAVAFSVLTKFNVSSWLESYEPSMEERLHLLNYISQGLTLCGSKPPEECEVLIEVYRHHFRHLVEYQFPDHYNSALRLLISSTDSSNIIPVSWSDLCLVISPKDHPGEGCRLGLHEVQESARLLSQHYLEKRTSSGQTLYSLIAWEYIPLVGQFLHLLCQALVSMWADNVAMDAAKPSAAIMECWKLLVDVFTPWIAPLLSIAGRATMLQPCSEVESGMMSSVVELMVSCISTAHHKLKDPTNSITVMGLVWEYYFTTLALADTPHSILQAYHVNLVKLPWCDYLPNLAAMDSMMKLKLLTSYPDSSFVFLGRILPLFNWNTIVEAYCNVNSHGDSAAPVQLHIMLLQLLVMLTAEKEVMEHKDTGIPAVMAEAQNYHWEYVDAKTYQDILQWQKSHCDPAMILHTGSCLSLSLRLLKAAAGFPSSSGVQEQLHPEMWEKRMMYIQVVVELIGSASHKKETHIHSYSDAISQLFQTALDVCVHEPQEQGSTHIVAMLQDILNLLNICSTATSVLQKIMDLIFVILEQMPNAHLITLPTISAGCHTIVSLSCMIKVVEHAIECHFKAIAKPDTPNLQLPQDINGYGWEGVTSSLVIPETSLEEFCQNCVGDCAALVLHTHLLQILPRCSSLRQEFDVAIRVVQWCTQMKPKPSQEAKVFLLWEKSISLLVRQVRFSGNYSEVVPYLTSLATSMTRFGEDKATEGILGVIGLGRKSSYSHQFRLISRAMAAFLHCQMPVDNGQTKLRVIPNAPGHVKESAKSQQSSSTISVLPTKLGDHSCNSLESLLNNKQYVHLKEHISYSVSFVNDASNCVMNSATLLVYLCTTLYPESRFLDLSRVFPV